MTKRSWSSREQTSWPGVSGAAAVLQILTKDRECPLRAGCESPEEARGSPALSPVGPGPGGLALPLGGLARARQCAVLGDPPGPTGERRIGGGLAGPGGAAKWLFQLRSSGRVVDTVADFNEKSGACVGDAARGAQMRSWRRGPRESAGARSPLNCQGHCLPWQSEWQFYRY